MGPNSAMPVMGILCELLELDIQRRTSRYESTPVGKYRKIIIIDSEKKITIKKGKRTLLNPAVCLLDLDVSVCVFCGNRCRTRVQSVLEDQTQQNKGDAGSFHPVKMFISNPQQLQNHLQLHPFALRDGCNARQRVRSEMQVAHLFLFSPPHPPPEFVKCFHPPLPNPANLCLIPQYHSSPGRKNVSDPTYGAGSLIKPKIRVDDTLILATLRKHRGQLGVGFLVSLYI